MMKECTELFLHYREVARSLWNLGLWPIPSLREWDCVEKHEEAMARVFEAVLLLAQGYQGRVLDPFYPGKSVELRVEIMPPGATALVDSNLPGDGFHVWGKPTVELQPHCQQLRFIALFDWKQLAPRDYRFLEVLIEAFAEHPELVGHHALVEPDYCSIWLVLDSEPPRKSLAQPAAPSAESAGAGEVEGT
jgi:hypothetical protein